MSHAWSLTKINQVCKYQLLFQNWMHSMPQNSCFCAAYIYRGTSKQTVSWQLDNYTHSSQTNMQICSGLQVCFPKGTLSLYWLLCFRAVFRSFLHYCVDELTFQKKHAKEGSNGLPLFSYGCLGVVCSRQVPTCNSSDCHFLSGQDGMEG